jgi:hypothetical protein
MVFSSQCQKGGEIIPIHPNPKPIEGHTAGEYYYHEHSASRDARNPRTKFIRGGGEKFAKPKAERWI